MWYAFGGIVIAVALLYGAICVNAWFNQERMVFLPAASVTTTPAAAGLPYREHYIDTADGERLHAWHVNHPRTRYTALFLHGNAGNIGHRIATLGQLHRLGLGVLIVDYRGYGRSTGRPGEQGLYTDADAAWRFLTGELGVAPEHVILHGRSLGAAVAAELATRTRPAAVILEAAFTSMVDLGRHHYPFLPVRRLARIHFDTLARIDRIHAPLLIVHSPGDEIVPIGHGRRLFERARQPKSFLRIEGDHNNAFFADQGTYLAGLREFIDGLP